MTTDTPERPDAATGTKLAAHTPQDAPVLDKGGYARRWLFSRRHIDTLISEGLPHCAIGKRRVRIVVAEADRWMIARYGTQRRGRAKRQEAA